MQALLFCLVLFFALFLIYFLLFKALPKEHWQFVAIIPLKKLDNGSWRGLNLTFYGFFFTACAGAIAIGIFLLLTFSINITLSYTLVMTFFMLGTCLSAARFVNILVEKKNHGFTVGGASFVGIVLAPIMLYIMDIASQKHFDTSLPMMPIFAAMTIAYILGEGFGRLGCISFGCCHGKAVVQLSEPLQKLFSKIAEIYEGDTKKIAYASKLHNTKVVPIQAITCSLYTLVGLIGVYLFLNNHYTLAFLITLLFSQVWRILSEMLRSDFRGYNKITAYQIMAIIACIYCILLPFIFPVVTPTSSLVIGLESMWSVPVIFALQIVWVIMFLFSGTSTVTNSEIKYTIDLKRI